MWEIVISPKSCSVPLEVVNLKETKTKQNLLDFAINLVSATFFSVREHQFVLGSFDSTVYASCPLKTTRRCWQYPWGKGSWNKTNRKYLWTTTALSSTRQWTVPNLSCFRLLERTFTRNSTLLSWLPFQSSEGSSQSGWWVGENQENVQCWVLF